jgi:hypothetical protein
MTMKTNSHIFVICAVVLFVFSQAAFALTSDISMEGRLQIIRKEGNLWITDPNNPAIYGSGPVTIGLASEQGGLLLDYGCNFKQLLDNNVNNVNTTVAGGFFRIDVRPDAQYKREFFNVKYIPVGSITEETIYSVSTTGDMSCEGRVRATTFESFIPLGTPPITVVSSTACTYLNADMTDGYHLAGAPAAGMFISVEVTTGTTKSLTTVAGERVMVWAKGDIVPNSATARTITLQYNAVTKDTVIVTDSAASVRRWPFALQYTEVPGAATNNITVNTTGGTLANVVIMVQKIKGIY